MPRHRQAHTASRSGSSLSVMKKRKDYEQVINRSTIHNPESTFTHQNQGKTVSSKLNQDYKTLFFLSFCLFLFLLFTNFPLIGRFLYFPFTIIVIQLQLYVFASIVI